MVVVAVPYCVIVPPEATVTFKLFPNTISVVAVMVTAELIVSVPESPEYVPGSKLQPLEIVTFAPVVGHVVAANAGVAVVNSVTKKPTPMPKRARRSRTERKNERGMDIRVLMPV